MKKIKNLPDFIPDELVNEDNKDFKPEYAGVRDEILNAPQPIPYEDFERIREQNGITLVYESNWDFDESDAVESMIDMDRNEIARIIEVPLSDLKQMSDGEVIDYAEDKIHHCPALLDNFIKLPSAVVLPENVLSEIESQVSLPEEANDFLSQVTDYLSEKFGFCLNGYKMNQKWEVQLA